MRKFAANYLVSESGIFLKNGIVTATEDGTILSMIDTKGDLRETEQLIFYNGILIAGYSFIKTNAVTAISKPDQSISSIVLESIKESNQISIQNLNEIGKRVQVQFPEMKIPTILNEISKVLQTSGGYTKENLAGIYLLTGANLIELRFTPKSRLKKIL